jgi:hypothetical protein
MKKTILTLLTLTSLFLAGTGLSQRITWWPAETEIKHFDYDYNYERATEYNRLALRIMFRNVLEGRPWHAVAIARLYVPNVEVIINEEYGYVMFHEKGNKGWAHLVINTNDIKHDREVALLAPHKKNDLKTDEEASYLFKSLSNAKFAIISGSTRGVSDAARNRNSIFYHYVRLISERPQTTDFYSLHGNARKTCKEVFLTNGTYADNDDVRSLKRYLKSFGVDMGGYECGYRGVTNLNGQLVRSNDDNFFHVEQSYRFRKYQSVLLYMAMEGFYGEMAERD